ncbi:MAG: glycosyltransferase family 1 protein [Candidatus Velthaea sp.]
MSRPDVLVDRRLTSHMSAGMTTYARMLVDALPRVAPDLGFVFAGDGDNFDLAEQVALPLQILRSRPRVVHYPAPFVPLVTPAPFIITVHDLIDLHYPQFGKRRVGPYYRYAVGPAARRARAVITDDEITIPDLKRFLGVDPGRVRIVPLGVDLPDPLPAPAVHPRPYFLYVGNHRPHKNLITLVRAWSALPESCGVDLLFTGPNDVGNAFDSLQRPDAQIVFLGDRTEEELVAYYRAARAYVHPALREGFGLPLLEAMRAGVAVVAAHGALPRILAPYAYPFEAGDAEELRALLRRVLDEPEHFARAAEAAQAATRALTWEATARATAAVYREFL